MKADTSKPKAPLKENSVEDNAVEEEETMTHAETFANYHPAKLKLGQLHPDPVVETSSLSSVQPPRIFYELALPEATIDSGSISALQLESVVYACQRHERFLADDRRAGFLIGDGAGVGKGRTIAGIIFENYLLDRKKALWLVSNSNLKMLGIEMLNFRIWFKKDPHLVGGHESFIGLSSYVKSPIA